MWQNLKARRSVVWIGLPVVAAIGLGSIVLRDSHSHAQGPAVGAPAAADSAAVGHAKGLSRAFRGAANVILPSVVTIETSTKPAAARNLGNRRFREGENPFKGTPFEDFFNGEDLEQFGGRLPRSMPRQQWTGSGVIIDENGTILTNNHVVNGADVVKVRLADGREFTAGDVKTDPQTDLAIIRIKGADKLVAAKLGDSNDLEVGDWVLAVGNPFGLEQTVSAGIISGKGRSIGAASRAQFLQTDAAINPGNSGGPLVNLDGEIVGINTAIASNGGGNDGIGFAVPVNLAKWVVPQLVAGGEVKRAYLGVGIEQLGPELASKFGVQPGEGVLVTEVFPGSPAADAGLREGDIILDFNGTKVHTPRDLQEVVERATLDSKQKANVLRDGKPTIVEVVARSLPNDFGRSAKATPRNPEDAAAPEGFTEKSLGVEVSAMNPAEARQLGYEGYRGVLLTQVDADGAAYEAGLREGMLVRKVGQKEVTTVAEFRDAMAEQSLKDGVLLLVRTPQGNRYVVIERK